MLQRQNPPALVMVVRVESAEIDEIWSLVQSKRQQRWLWHAIADRTVLLLAYVLAPHTDAVAQLQQLLAPFSIGQFSTDSWSAYLRWLDPQQHTVSKANT